MQLIVDNVPLSDEAARMVVWLEAQLMKRDLTGCVYAETLYVSPTDGIMFQST